MVGQGALRGQRHIFRKKLTQVTPPALALAKLLQLLVGLDCLPSESVIPISDGSGFLPSVVFSMAIQTGASSWITQLWWNTNLLRGRRHLPGLRSLVDNSLWFWAGSRLTMSSSCLTPVSLPLAFSISIAYRMAMCLNLYHKRSMRKHRCLIKSSVLNLPLELMYLLDVYFEKMQLLGTY